MKNIKTIVASLALVIGVTAPVLTPAVASAANTTNTATSGACTSASSCVSDGVTSTGGTSSKTDIKGIIRTVVNALLFLIGAVSVIMIVVGGFRYVVSQGDSSAVASAKNTILYAVIGLVVALMAYAIVAFVVDHLK